MITLGLMSINGTTQFLVLQALFKVFKRFLSKTTIYYLQLSVILVYVLPICKPVSNTTIYDAVAVPLPPIIASASADIAGTETGHNWILYIWLAGSILILILKVASYLKYCTTVLNAASGELPGNMSSKYQDICDEFGLEYAPELCYCPYASESFLMWCGGYKIVLSPKGIDSESSLEMILRHEVIHFIRRDIWYKYCLEMISVIHWFNPFLCYCKAKNNESCELACDEALIQHLSSDQKKLMATCFCKCATMRNRIW